MWFPYVQPPKTLLVVRVLATPSSGRHRTQSFHGSRRIACTAGIITISDSCTYYLLCSLLVPVVRVRHQLLYPILMFVMVCRTIVLRVRPDALIAFEPTNDLDTPKDVLLVDSKDSFFSRVKLSWKQSGSLIAWADAGQWVTVERSYTESRPEDDWSQTSVDEDARREGDRFRIGFEPLFVDFTKAGSWFMIYSLVQVRVILRKSCSFRYPHHTSYFSCATLIASGLCSYCSTRSLDHWHAYSTYRSL